MIGILGRLDRALLGERAFAALRLAFYVAKVRESRRMARAGLDGSERSARYEGFWRQAAADLGATVEPLGYDFFAIRDRGRATTVCRNLVMIDDPIALELAGNKALVYSLIAKGGLPVPRHLEFSPRSLTAAVSFLREVGGPCVVKPNGGTGAGRGITTGVRTTAHFLMAAANASLYGRGLVIERQVAGDSLRLLYLDGQMLDALRWKRPTVTGDGRSSVRQLLVAENRRRRSVTQRAVVGWIPLDLDCRLTLRQAGLSPHSVLPAGRRVVVRGVANQGSESDVESVRHCVAPDLVAEGARAAAAVGVRLAGVDMITSDPTRSLAQSGGVINEINTTPGLHTHYLVEPAQRVAVATPILRALLARAATAPPMGCG